MLIITVALAAMAVVAAIFVVARGGGGELSVEHPDHPPSALPGRRPLGGTDAALLRLPLGLWGYHQRITDEALERFAHELTERDTRIAVLEQELAEARRRLNGDSTTRDADLPGFSDAPDDPSTWRAADTDLPPLPDLAEDGPPKTAVDDPIFESSRIADGKDRKDGP